MPPPQVYRSVVWRLTGVPEIEGTKSLVIIHEGHETVVRNVAGTCGTSVPVTFSATGDVEWHGNEPVEVWVPVDRVADWRSAHP